MEPYSFAKRVDVIDGDNRMYRLPFGSMTVSTGTIQNSISSSSDESSSSSSMIAFIRVLLLI